MKVFISWSGEPSKQVAELLSTWLVDVIQGIEPWISTSDIDKGSLWFNEITGQLSGTGFGIICLTRSNMNAPWILFEAGALSKGLEKNRVCPLLVDFRPSELAGPLAQFHCSGRSKDEMLKLLKAINGAIGEKRLKDDRLEKAFNLVWDEFDKKVNEVVKHDKSAPKLPPRKVEDMVVELLEISRSIQQSVSGREAALARAWAEEIKSDLSGYLWDPEKLNLLRSFLGPVDTMDEKYKRVLDEIRADQKKRGASKTPPPDLKHTD